MALILPVISIVFQISNNLKLSLLQVNKTILFGSLVVLSSSSVVQYFRSVFRVPTVAGGFAVFLSTLAKLLVVDKKVVIMRFR